MSRQVNLKEIHDTLLDRSFKNIREEDPILAKVIGYRLIVERLGEQENNEWWDSSVLSDFGNESLSEVIPKTAHSRRVLLAQKVGKKVENEKTPEDAISLFDLGTHIENKIHNKVTENQIRNLDPIETLSNIVYTNKGWAGNLVPVDNPSGKPTQAFEVGTANSKDLAGRELESAVQNLVGAYGRSTKTNLCVPYFTVET